MQLSHTLTGNRQKQNDKNVGRLPETSPGGLTLEEVAARREQYGYNELPEEKRSAIKQFLSYFWGPIPWMIETAAILSALVRHWEDLVIILTLLVVNAGVGFWEEHQAGNTIAALKKKLAHQARVRRAGEWQMIPARDLVPGDLIRLRLGDIVPADSVLGDGDPVEVDQSALTGESLPVHHKAGETVYAGSVLRQGEIDAVVNATGKHTYFGKTAELVKTDQPASHFQRAVLRIGNFLIILALALAVVILAAAVMRGDTLTTTLQFVLVLTVAAIPVAMPTVLSVTMAAGARLLARREAVVSRLASIEEMAGIDVLCSDKTGTLTQNRLTLGDPFTSKGIQPEQVVLAAALASRAEDGDPIDQAVLSGLKDSARSESYQVHRFQPFDPIHKRTEASVKSPDGRQFKVSKGAPQVILSLTGIPPEVQSQAETAIDSFAGRGFRSLGVAQTGEGGGWQFLGILPLYDPPRDDSKATIEAAKSMGVKVKMVTGDQAAIAREIAGQLGLGKNILNADLFPAGEADAQQVNEMIESADGFAQVFPEHKYNIVKALQASGHYVGMTGDGVNDAPALKAADAGVAVSGATDAARSAADIVLLTPGLKQ